MMEDFVAFGAYEEPVESTPAVGSKRRRSPSPLVVRAGSRAAAGTPALPPGVSVPWQISLTGAFKSLPSSALLRLHEEVLDFAQFMSPTPSEQEYADTALTRITEAVLALYPEARAEVFGSRANGLVLPTSDWDIVLFNVPSGSFTMYRIAAEIERRGLSRKTEVIDSARIPIVKVRDKVSGIMIDISFAAASALVTRALINELITRYPAVRPLVLVLKYFLIQRGLNETYTGGIGSFMLVLMVVHTVQMRMAAAGCFDDISGGNGGRPRERHDLNLGSLLLSFLELFGHNLNYISTGISVRGVAGCYYNKRKKGWFDSNRPWLLSIENPVDPTTDVGKNSWAVQRVRRAFQHAHSQLSRAIRLYAGQNIVSSADSSSSRRGERAQRLPASLLEQVIPIDSLLRTRAAELLANGGHVSVSSASAARSATASNPECSTDSPALVSAELPARTNINESDRKPSPFGGTHKLLEPDSIATASDMTPEESDKAQVTLEGTPDSDMSVSAARARAEASLSRSGVQLRHTRLLADVMTRRLRNVQAIADECALSGRWF